MIRVNVTARWLSLLAAVAMLLAACATPIPAPIENAVQKFELAKSKDDIFDSAVSVSQELNLTVSLIERQTGLIQFESVALNPSQLDRYCKYPVLNARTRQSWDTFSNWNQRSVMAGTGNVRGSVKLSLLVQELSPTGAGLSIRSNFSAENNTERSACASTGALESDVRDAISSYGSRMRGSRGEATPAHGTPKGCANVGSPPEIGERWETYRSCQMINYRLSGKARTDSGTADVFIGDGNDGLVVHVINGRVVSWEMKNK